MGSADILGLDACALVLDHIFAYSGFTYFIYFLSGSLTDFSQPAPRLKPRLECEKVQSVCPNSDYVQPVYGTRITPLTTTSVTSGEQHEDTRDE